MKKSFLRGITGLLLAICIFSVPLATSFGASAQNNSECPVIFVPGFMGNDVYLHPGTDEQELLFPPSTEKITDMLKSCVGPLTKFAFNRDWDALGETLSPIVYDLLSPVYNGKDGSPVDDSGPDWSYDTVSPSSDGSYTFQYDWRLDPADIAVQLKTFVDYIKLCTEASQVNIRCHSMGGIVMLCYLNLYGYEDLHAIMYDTTAIYGETFNGELFTNQLELSDDAILSFMRFAFYGSEYETFMNNFFTALYNLGIINSVCGIGDIILENTYDEIAKVVVPMFAYYPGIWAMVPDEYIPEARAYVFGELLADGVTDYSVLEGKLDAYDTNFRAGKTEKLLDSAEHMRVGVISRYNFSAIPATKSWFTMSDATVDSKSSSFGATFANYGEALSDEYVTSLTTTEYLSPDKKVDASTALFPEKTWIIRDLSHSRHCNTLDDLTELFFNSENEIDIHTDERFPQYMLYNSTDECAYPFNEDDVKDTAKPGLNIFSFIKEFFKKIIDALTAVFKPMGC